MPSEKEQVIDPSPAPTRSNPSIRAASPVDSVGSEGERPIREQLKKATIDGEKATAPTSAPSASAISTSNDNMVSVPEQSQASQKQPPNRKRSFEELGEDDEQDRDGNQGRPGRHGRKRSREIGKRDDSSPERSLGDTSTDSSDPDQRQQTPIESKSLQEKITSPKGKRNRDQYLKDEDENGVATLEPVSVVDPIDTVKADTSATVKNEEPEAKRHRDDDKKTDDKESHEEIMSTAKPYGFGNISTASPFGAISGTSLKNSPSLSTSTSTSTSLSEPSAFGKLGTSTTSPFGTVGNSNAKSAFTSFGSTLKAQPVTESSMKPETKSPFGVLGSKPTIGTGFGGLGGSSSSPFALSGGPGLSTITAAGTKPPILGLSSKPAKAFGAPESESENEDEDDENEDDGDEEETSQSKDTKDQKDESTKKDKRFQEQDLETGEEGEDTIFSARAKVYAFDGSWHERGVGVLKLNITNPPEDADLESGTESPLILQKARFLLRADGSQRVVINTPFTRQTTFGGDSNGERPNGNVLLFYGFLHGEDKAAMLQVKMKPANALKMWEEAERLRNVL